MKVTQKITLFNFIGGRFRNTDWRTFSFQREHSNRGYPVYSGVMVCPICRQIWAELEIEGSKVFQPRMVSCVQCNWKGSPGYEWLNPVAGSLLDNWTAHGVDWSLLDALPPELLEREFLLTLAAAERCPEAFETEVQDV